MLNRQFVLLKLNKYLNSAREISAEEFDILFAELTKKEQYEVIRIMIEEDIQYVDEKTPEETEEEITLAQKSGYSLKQEDYLSFSSAMLLIKVTKTKKNLKKLNNRIIITYERQLSTINYC